MLLDFYNLINWLQYLVRRSPEGESGNSRNNPMVREALHPNSVHVLVQCTNKGPDTAILLLR